MPNSKTYIFILPNYIVSIKCLGLLFIFHILIVQDLHIKILKQNM